MLAAPQGQEQTEGISVKYIHSRRADEKKVRAGFCPGLPWQRYGRCPASSHRPVIPSLCNKVLPILNLSLFILRAVEIQCQPPGRKITEGLIRRLRDVPARDRADPQSNDLREVSPLAVKRAATV